MITVNKDDRLYLKSDLLEECRGIEHFFTTKVGGLSRGKIEGLNLGFRVGDDAGSVVGNYRLISSDFGIPFENITAAKQIHSADIRVITKAEAGQGVSRIDEVFEADGLITNCPGIPLTVFYADCVPILLAEEDVGVIAAVHSGWRGTVAQIAKRAMDVMTKQFGAKLENIKAAIGPSIGGCCFETGPEVAAEFSTELVESLPDGKFKVDLWEANRKLLIESGIREINIDVLGLCTICNSDLLYSYRTHGENTGRMGAVIMLGNEI